MDEQRVAAGADAAARARLDDMLRELESWQWAKANAEARELKLMAAVAAWRPAGDATIRETWAHESWIREEVSTVLRVAPMTAGARLARATTLVEDLPRTLEALEAGTITSGHASAVVDAVAPLDVRAAEKLERRVLRNAHEVSVSEFRARCRRAVIAVDPEGAERRHAAAKKQRDVAFRPGTDGMGQMCADLDQATLARVKRRIAELANTIVNDSDESDDRTIGAVRADVVADLLTGDTDRLPGPVKGRATRQTHVTIAFTTLIGLDNLPASIDGDAAPASLARELANDPRAWWRPVLVDRDGRLEAIGSRAYKPSAALRRTVELHDLTCQFPGCRRRAEYCELDHAKAFDHDHPEQGGLTELANLHCLCKRHHRLKHETGWGVWRINGVSHWRSPTDRYYTKINDGYLTAETEAVLDEDFDPPDRPASDGPGTPPDESEPDDPPPY